MEQEEIQEEQKSKDIYGYISKDQNFEAWATYDDTSAEDLVDAPLTMHQIEPEIWQNELYTGKLVDLDAYVRTKYTQE